MPPELSCQLLKSPGDKNGLGREFGAEDCAGADLLDAIELFNFLLNRHGGGRFRRFRLDRDQFGYVAANSSAYQEIASGFTGGDFALFGDGGAAELEIG